MSTIPATPDVQPIAHHVREMIRGLGEDVEREGLVKKPERVEAAM
jgi:GTP cyclohydrolase I